MYKLQPIGVITLPGEQITPPHASEQTMEQASTWVNVYHNINIHHD